MHKDSLDVNNFTKIQLANFQAIVDYSLYKEIHSCPNPPNDFVPPGLQSSQLYLCIPYCFEMLLLRTIFCCKIHFLNSCILTNERHIGVAMLLAIDYYHIHSLLCDIIDRHFQPLQYKLWQLIEVE